MTLHPIKNELRKKRLKKEFWVIGVISSLLIGFQTFRASKSYSQLIEEIKKNQNAAVTLANVPTLAPPFVGLVRDSKLQINVGYQITSNTAKNFRVYSALWLENSPPNGHEDKEVFTRFKVEAMKYIPDRGGDRGPTTGDWQTLTLDLYGDSAPELVAGKRTVYILARVEWNNPSGSDSHLDVCLYLQKPTRDILFRPEVVWRNCDLN